MQTNGQTDARKLHGRLRHPVIDADGHWIEYGPVMKKDIRDLFVPRFYFGCEADDPTNAWAFNRQASPMRARLNALFS